jgi:predicted dehydrogenase
MPKKIKVGVLTHAAGAHVGAYLSALAEADSCGEVVLADADGRWEKDARRVLGDKLTNVYRNYEKLLSRERPVMSLVTMEAKLAPPVIDAALESGCHVFAEKPSCVRVEDFEPLVRKADSQHRHLMLALANRTNPEIAEARRLIAGGAIGKLYGLDMHLIADQTRLTRKSYHQQWFAQKGRAGGGHLIWLGIHWLDLAMYVTQSSITDVAGFTANVGGQPIDVEDSAAAALRFDNGTLGTITSGYYLDKGYHSHIKIWGSDGWLHLESMKDKPLQWYSTLGEKSGMIQTWTGSKEPRGYTPFVSEAVTACAEMTDPPISNSDSLRALKTVFSIYSAATSGRTVRI